MELEEVTRFLNMKDNIASFNKEKERRKIEIQEVNLYLIIFENTLWGILYWILKSDS